MKKLKKVLSKEQKILLVSLLIGDDRFININESIKRHGSIQRTIKISTCIDKETCEMMIEYFKEK